MRPEGRELESARVLSLARGPHSEHSIFAGTFATENKGPKTMGLRAGPDVKTSHYVPFTVCAWWSVAQTLFSLHLFRPLIKGAGSDMSPPTRTG